MKKIFIAMMLPAMSMASPDTTMLLEALDSLDCGAQEVALRETSQYSEGVISQEYEFYCDLPNEELVAAINLNGPRMTVGGTVFERDWFSFIDEQGGTDDTYRYFSQDRHFRVPIKNGNYRYVMSVLGSECPSPGFSVEVEDNSASHRAGSHVFYRESFTVIDGYMDIRFTHNNCDLDLYAFELWRVNSTPEEPSP